MSAIKVYHYDNCGTCRKARKWLDAQGIAHTLVPIREQPPTKAELARVLKASGGELRRLFNTSGGDYKAMNMKAVLPRLSVDEALDLLAQHGNLVKRPLVVGNGVALAGFDEDAWRTAFGI
ncbi:MAG: arsenate reductase family protein [Candidatus Hydrogenedentes bacterium]|nr:arsenate reductase family protein [Candidatus Hydrogenedentota bacterium]